jgi:hypothetical protein
MLRTPFYGRLLFLTTPAGTEAGGGNPVTPLAPPASGANPATPPKTEAPAPVTFTAEQQAEINRIVGQARQEGRTAAEQAAAQAETDRQAEAARQADIDKGNFEAAKTSLEGERDGFKAERDTLKTERDALAGYFDGQFAAALKDLPESIVAFAPAEDASFADKKAWLVKATEQAAKLGGESKPGNGPNPKPGEKPNATVEQAADQMRGRVSI